MQVKPGYKQTEVGLIPEEWQVKSVRDLGQIKTGPFGTLLKAQEYSGSEGVPLISVGEVGSGTFKVTEHTPLVPDAVIRRLPQYVLRNGDIVFGRKGAVERSALVTESEDGWFLGSDGISIRPQQMCHPPYLAWQFQRYEVQAWLLQNAIGTTMASLNQGILSRVQIPYAPFPEQRAIARALSDVDALIGAQDRLIGKKRNLKQAAMQQLLTGQKRLPGFHGEWDVKRLGQICEIGMGRTPPRLNPAYWGRGYKWLSIADLKTKIVSESNEEITELAASEMMIIPKGTLLMSFKLSIGRLCFAGCDLFTNEAICSFNKLQANADFLYYALGRTDFSLYGKQAVKGYTLNKESLKIVEVRLPSPAEQTAIAEVLSDMDAEIAALEQRRDKTRALKQGMMQELLTGRTRLVDSPRSYGQERL
jgi:type I restriction enzyme S subunit